MFDELKTKLSIRDNLMKKIDELTDSYHKDVEELQKMISDLEINDIDIRKYTVAVYAIENFSTCKNMSINEAFEYVDMLNKKEAEREKEQ